MTATKGRTVTATQITTGLLSVEDAEQLSVGEVHDLYRRYVNRSQVKLMTSLGFGRELVDHAEGCWIHTRDGRRILDFTGGVGVLNHGHNHPRIIAARRRFQERSRMEVHKTYFSPYIAALGHNLAALLPEDLTMSFFPNSGAEAVEGAVKLAYKYHDGERGTVLSADIAFHGKLLGSGGLTGAQSTFTFPTIPGIDHFAFGDLDSVRETVARHRRADGTSDVYALLVEPFSATTMRECSEEFLRGVRDLCTAEGIVLIFDEIHSGWGKTGSLFHFMRYPGLVPDVMTTSKAFGGGKSSISGFVARESVFRPAYDNLLDALLQSTSTTYYGFGEEAATAIEAVRVAVEDDYPARARAIGDQLVTGLRRIQDRFPDLVADVQGAGALQGIFLSGSPRLIELAARYAPGGLSRDPLLPHKLITAAVINTMYQKHGVYLYYTLNGKSPLVAAPPLVAGESEVAYFLTAFEETLALGMPQLLAALIKDKVWSLWN